MNLRLFEAAFKRPYSVLLLTVLWGWPAVAIAACEFQDFLQRATDASEIQAIPEIIPYHADKELKPFEIAEGWGKRIRQPKDLQNLKDGHFVYLITEDGEKWFTPRDPFYALEEIHARGGGMATHRSLMKKYFETHGRYPKIVAAGEFEISCGEVSRFTNKSGTFRGGNINLKYAIQEFHRSGMKFEKNTKFLDYSKKSGKLSASPEQPVQLKTEQEMKAMDIDAIIGYFNELKNHYSKDIEFHAHINDFTWTAMRVKFEGKLGSSFFSSAENKIIFDAYASLEHSKRELYELYKKQVAAKDRAVAAGKIDLDWYVKLVVKNEAGLAAALKKELPRSELYPHLDPVRRIFFAEEGASFVAAQNTLVEGGSAARLQQRAREVEICIEYLKRGLSK